MPTMYEEGITEPDETERILANAYLTGKLEQSRKDMHEGKGEKITINDLWK